MSETQGPQGGSSTESLDDREARSRGWRDYTGDSSRPGAAMQDAIGRAADQAKSTAARLGRQAQDTYGRVSARARGVADRVDPIVKEQPYASLGAAAAVGLLAGLLLAGRGPKVIYLKQKS